MWILIGWLHSSQPMRIHDRKSLLQNTEFNMDFVIQAPG